MPSWTRAGPNRAASCCRCRAASHRARGAVLSRTLEALGEWGVLLGIVFYVESSVRQLRCEGVLISVGLREDFGGC